MYWPCGVPGVYAHISKPLSEPGSGGNDESPGLEQLNGDASEKRSNETEAVDHELGAIGSSAILDVRFARSDALFATITARSLNIWSSKPTTVLTSHERSVHSLKVYGHNISVRFRPDSKVVLLRTSGQYIIRYDLESDPSSRVYQQQYQYTHARRQSIARQFGGDDSTGIGEITLRFRRAIKIDAGINDVIALDRDLIIATAKPAAIQCIKWEVDSGRSQATAQLVNKMPWTTPKSSIVSMIQDRAMGLMIWISQEGSAYAVRRSKPQESPRDSVDSTETEPQKDGSVSGLFEGYRFHTAAQAAQRVTLAAINARFSLIAVSLAGNQICCYAAKDYEGNIPLSHTFEAPASTGITGAISCMVWSPDGYCLFVGYEHGFAMWSVFGKEGASSFHLNQVHAETHGEKWLLHVTTASWSGGGSELFLTSKADNRIWRLHMSRSAAVGCFSSANLVRALMPTPTELTIYRGHELRDLTSISNEASLWHHAQYPPHYLQSQWPIKACVASQDGRYVAIAGRRGLAHYSVQSRRWKSFADSNVQNSFAVRGGMCWFHHILAVATEFAGGYDLRLYSRDTDLGRNALSQETFAMPIVFIGPSGEDSLLVYTYENILYHYILNTTSHGAQLVQVGQIAFHGVVRAPSRVRSVSWILPDSQMRTGDPSRDVEYASVLFLVDDKLVLLQPSQMPDGSLRYDMKVIAQYVEYYILMRDQISFNFANHTEASAPGTPSPGATLNSFRNQAHHTLRDSLWIFCGHELKMWSDVRDVLRYAVDGNILDDVPLLSVPVDFYPLSILLTKGVVLGVESELLQRRDVSFAQYRSAIRTQLFIPYILRQQLCSRSDATAAFGLAVRYQHLSYFAHAVEILLHHVLDDEVDTQNRVRDLPSEHAITASQIPNVLSFLQMVLSPANYLSTIVNCIRKTELTSWKNVLAHLPPPLTLFEQALELDDLKTASGYLIVLQGLDEEEGGEQPETTQLEVQVVRLMKLAAQKADFELCAELARFIIGIDPRGQALKRVIDSTGLRTGFMDGLQAGSGVGLGVQIIDENEGVSMPKTRSPGKSLNDKGERPAGDSQKRSNSVIGGDYFTNSPGGY